MQLLKQLFIKMRPSFPIILGMTILIVTFFPTLGWNIDFPTKPDNGSDMRYMYALASIVSYLLRLLPIALALLIIFAIFRLHKLIEFDSPGVLYTTALSFAWLSVMLFLAASTAVPGGGCTFSLGLLLFPVLIIIVILLILAIVRVYFHMALVSWRNRKANLKSLSEAGSRED